MSNGRSARAIAILKRCFYGDDATGFDDNDDDDDDDDDDNDDDYDDEEQSGIYFQNMTWR